jgi:hypothetical protein
MLTPLGHNLWETNQPLKVMGFAVGHRMTVLRDANGNVAVHSPVRITSALAQDVRAVAGPAGQVRWIIAPSTMHDLYLEEWASEFPDATLCHSPGMKIPRGISKAETLRARPLPGFEGGLQAVFIGGMPKINEFVFHHRESGSLIVADLIFNLPPGRGMQKLLQKANGIYEVAGPSKFFRNFIANEEAFRASIQELLKLDFERVVVGHGHNLPSEGRERLRLAFRWLGI